jgi:hypothetical protein
VTGFTGNTGATGCTGWTGATGLEGRTFSKLTGVNGNPVLLSQSSFRINPAEDSLNADEVRKQANDWDFSKEGRARQAKRMKDLSNEYLNQGKKVSADFVHRKIKIYTLSSLPLLLRANVKRHIKTTHPSGLG